MNAQILPFPAARARAAGFTVAAIAAAAPNGRRVVRLAPARLGFGYDVSITPALLANAFDRHFTRLDAARRYAGLLHRVNGWPIVDETGGPSGEAA